MPMSHAGFSSPKILARVLASGVRLNVTSEPPRDSTMVTGLPFPAPMPSATAFQFSMGLAVDGQHAVAGQDAGRGGGSPGGDVADLGKQIGLALRPCDAAINDQRQHEIGDRTGQDDQKAVPRGAAGVQFLGGEQYAVDFFTFGIGLFGFVLFPGKGHVAARGGSGRGNSRFCRAGA